MDIWDGYEDMDFETINKIVSKLKKDVLHYPGYYLFGGWVELAVDILIPLYVGLMVIMLNWNLDITSNFSIVY